MVNLYHQNFDFAVFSLLCERVFNELESVDCTIRNRLPFCLFQHNMTSMLNAKILSHVITENKEDCFSNEANPDSMWVDDLIIPAPIAEYFSCIGNTITPKGECVRLNLPEVAVPRHEQTADGAVPALPTGSFGPVIAANHNVYECYVSPLVTANLIAVNIAQNIAGVFADRAPLPAGAFPAGAIPNQNLLGYRDVERLSPEGLEVLDNLHLFIRCMCGRTLLNQIHYMRKIVASSYNQTSSKNHVKVTAP